jgi:hypothetical protein
MPKRRRKPATVPPASIPPTVVGAQARTNPDLAFARTVRTGGAWFPAVWPM